MEKKEDYMGKIEIPLKFDLYLPGEKREICEPGVGVHSVTFKVRLDGACVVAETWVSDKDRLGKDDSVWSQMGMIEDLSRYIEHDSVTFERDAVMRGGWLIFEKSLIKGLANAQEVNIPALAG